MTFIIAQIIGTAGLICSLLSFQQNKRNRVMALQMTASIMFAVQLFMVGAFTGGCLDVIAFVRTLIFKYNDTQRGKSPAWLVLFVVLMIITGIMTWTDIYSILPIIGSVLSTVAMWMKSCKNIRLVSLFVGPCWIVYNIINGAYTGALNEVLAISSIVIGLIRYDIKKKKGTV